MLASRELPRQLVPTDLVGKETFSRAEILDVRIPKPECDTGDLREMDTQLKRLEAETEAVIQKIAERIPGG